MAGKIQLHVVLGDSKPVEITLTPGLSELFMDVFRLVAMGNAVTFVPR